jgi:hypothetical protein
MKWLREVHGRKWKPGTRLPQNVEGLSPPDFWLRPDGKSSPRNPNPETPVYSHWFSTDPFSTFRWYPDKPFGVVVAAVLDRAIHPVHDRTLTFREAARFMSIPDDWSLRKLVEANKGAELGKAVPSASAKWIAHWARMSIEGTPGEYAGVADTGDDIIRVINVQRKPDIEAILASPPPNSLWSEPTADPDPATWLIDQRSRPAKWPQREFDPVEVRTSPDKEDALKPAKTRRQTGPRRARTPSGTGATGSGIVRIEPERVAQVIAQAGLDKKAAAERLGVSVSRVNELTSHARPGSWLNAERWDDVQEKLRG